MEDIGKLGSEVVHEYINELTQLHKNTRIFFTILDVKHNLNQIRKLGPTNATGNLNKETLEFNMLLTALCASYGRLFAESNGVARISRNDVPSELKSVHDELIELRNKRYAHHDKHHSILDDMEYDFDGKNFTLYPRMTASMPTNVLEHTDKLIKWVSEHLARKTEKQLTKLSEKSGYVWKIDQ